MKSPESDALQARYRLACELAQAGAELAFEYYQQRDRLAVDHKGDDLQDVVSVADKRVEEFVKQRIISAFRRMVFSARKAEHRCLTPACCGLSTLSTAPAVFLTACTLVSVDGHRRRRRTGYRRGVRPQPSRAVPRPERPGAWLNDAPIAPHPAATVKEGVMGVGTSHRVTPAIFLPFLDALLSDGGMFIRNGSGR